MSSIGVVYECVVLMSDVPTVHIRCESPSVISPVLQPRLPDQTPPTAQTRTNQRPADSPIMTGHPTHSVSPAANNQNLLDLADTQIILWDLESLGCV